MLIMVVSTMVFPIHVSAATENKTTLVFEIKISDLTKILEGKKTEPKPEPVVTPTPVAKSASKYALPPKTVGDARVYMHEPEIRAYICPKIGDINKCNIFIAVLKAENGTHECTRDNRGLNRNGSVDIGLAQINWRPGNPWHTFEQLQDCKYNLDVALEMYSRRGFQPWYAYTKGAYLKHLPAVLASAKIIAETAPVEPLIN
ncbi:MAG: hypothetical protein A3C49_04160 [Candidatus Doudnabacteria bacterium RIFCSPHIGHO2_02_FULL_42_25]|nr:MAG: hypothetical protein A3E28_00175 [Candidatus Doudnabacteria bacterium RIFCSPHIGHO2_12_FULL_42_22]OGE87391.1 MAG: hypothetical protein A3C49_04160 [Candidatus Doudnabacteria bacterium RIFCSPHIGHO2_02_FULL_42_25]